MKPFLRWVGGKWRIADHIVSLMPDKIGTYYEPFLGSGAVFIKLLAQGKKVDGYRLSDINQHVVNLWLSLQADCPSLCTEIQSLLDGYNSVETAKQKEMYFEWRTNLSCLEGIPQAATFIALNLSAFNALVRYNKSLKFNSAFGKRKHLAFDYDNLRILSAEMSKHDIQFSCRGFSDAVQDVAAGSTVYMDPPYVEETARKLDKGTYSAGGFGFHAELFGEYKRLDSAGARVVMSNHDCKSVSDNLADFDIVRLDLFKKFGGNGFSRQKTWEIIAKNF